jgi:asparagine synthase (glutamine-hydrolysing)
MVAERYDTEHHELTVAPNGSEVLPLLVRHYGEPFGDSSALPTYYLSRETRRHVTVALSGDGGDESFGGYEAYAAVMAWGRADLVPPGARRLLASGGDALLAGLPYHRWTNRARRGLRMLAADVPGRYALHTSILKPEERTFALTEDFRGTEAPVAGIDTPDFAHLSAADPLRWMSAHDQMHYLPDCLMVKVDIASMANSLEVRSPFLDNDLVDFAAMIPSHLKRNGGPGKRILRSLMRRRLPTAVIEKPKTGFGMPVAEWLRADMADLMAGCLTDDRARRRGMLEPSFIRLMIEEHAAGRRDWSSRLWLLINLELWFREFVD